MRISSIECGRVLAIMAVMTIHISPFSNPFDPTLWGDSFYLWLGGTINQLCRFAVPLFFLCAGYFLQPRLTTGNPMAVALRYCRPLLVLWLGWSLIYLLVRIERQQANAAASLNRLHRGMGTGLPWQLLGDLAALALLLLALTSLLMWNKLHGPPGRGMALLVSGAIVTLLIALL